MSERFFFRVDPRLIHATLMNAWVPALGADTVVVADSEAAEDGRRRTILEMSAMDAVRVLFVYEEDLRTMLDRIEADRVIVLFTSLETAETAVRSGLELASLNVGHVPAAPGSDPVHPSVHLGTAENHVIGRLEQRGIRVLIRPLPSDEEWRPYIGSRVPARSVAPGLPSKLPERAETPARAWNQNNVHPIDPHTETEQVEAILEIVNERGLHLRAAHVLASLASTLEAEVWVGPPNEMVNAKSLLGLTTLGATCGSKVRFVVTGKNAVQGMKAIRTLVAAGFSEGAQEAS